MKNSNDTIGNRTLDLLACSAVPQPTAPPRTPQLHMNNKSKVSEVSEQMFVKESYYTTETRTVG